MPRARSTRPGRREPAGRSRRLPDGTLVPRLASDPWRHSMASVAMALVSVPLTLLNIWRLRAEGRLGEYLQTPTLIALAPVLIGFVIYCVVYTVLTMRILHGVRGERLRAWLLVVDPSRDRHERLMLVLSGGGSVGYGVSVSLIAMTAVLMLVLRPDLIADRWTVVGAVASVIGAWVVLMITFAARYARFWANHEGVEFPGGEDRTWGDFCYLAVQVSTTFSSSDVSLTGHRVRSAVTAHSIVAFVYNTVVVAMLVSILVTV